MYIESPLINTYTYISIWNVYACTYKMSIMCISIKLQAVLMHNFTWWEKNIVL